MDLSYTLENDQPLFLSDVQKIDVAFKSLTRRPYHFYLEHHHKLKNVLIVLDVLSKEGYKIKLGTSRVYVPVHGNTENECLEHFCQFYNITAEPNLQFLRKWMTRFIVYKLEMETKDNPEKKVIFEEKQQFALYYFFIHHGKCLGCYNK